MAIKPPSFYSENNDDNNKKQEEQPSTSFDDGLPEFDEEDLSLELPTDENEEHIHEDFFNDDNEDLNHVEPQDDFIIQEPQPIIEPTPETTTLEPETNNTTISTNAEEKTNPNQTIEEETTPTQKKEAKNKKKKNKKRFKEGDFVDEKNKKLKPFGSTRKKLKTKDFDERKNKRQKALIIQIAVFSILFLIAGLGLKNAFFPPEYISSKEITQLVKTETNNKNYPLDKAEGFAKEFAKTYFIINDKQDLTSILSYYYDGEINSSSFSGNLSSTSQYKQTLLIGPNTYKKTALTPNVGNFVMGAYIKPEIIPETNIITDPNNPEQLPTPEVEEQSPFWMFISINVYYDKNADSFAITKDSPTIVPPVEVVNNGRIPNDKPLGNGETSNDLDDEVSATVIGFIKGYAVSSVKEHSAVDQYITDNTDITLIRGFNRSFEISGSEQNQEQISFEAYLTDNPNIVKVKAQVSWIKKINEETSSAFKSQYVLTLTKQANNKYLVSKFSPYYYVPEEN